MPPPGTWGILLFCGPRKPTMSAAAETTPPPKLASRTIAAGNGWLLRDILCTAGPADRAFEERHDSASISLVAAGSFCYRTDTGRSEEPTSELQSLMRSSYAVFCL